MQNFLSVFSAIACVINLCGLIWVAAVKFTRLEVKVEPMWKWFLSSKTRRDRNTEEDAR